MTYRILIIDEVEINQGKYGNYLNSGLDRDYTIITATSTQSVWDFCGHQPHTIDGIILSYQLSDQDGLGVLQRLKSEWGETCPPVVMIGENNTTLAVAAMKAGAADYLIQEQFTPKQLHCALETAIENTKIHQVRYSREERLRNIFDHTFQFIGLLSVDGILLEANQTALDFAGLTQADVINRPFWEARWWTISAATQEQLKNAIAQAVKGEFIRYEVEVLGIGNQNITIDFSLKPLLDQSGKVIFLLPEGRDISDKIRAEAERRHLEALLQKTNQELEQRVAQRTAELQQANAALAEREAMLRSYYDYAPMLMGVVEITDNDIRHIYDNPATCRFFGHEPGSTTGKLASELGVSPTVIQVWLIQYRESQLRSQPVKFEYVHDDNEKNPVYLSVTVAPINSSEFGYTRFCYVAEEITTQKQAEETLRQNQVKIRRQLHEIELIYQTAPIGLGALDTELRFVRINQRLAEINGLSIEAHLGRTVQETVPDLADEVEPIFRNIIETGKPVLDIELSGETAAQPGVQRTWRESWYPLQDDGQVIGINIVCEEISDRKQLEIEREQLLQKEQAARKQAEDSNRIKDEFLAVLSHELRTPLNPILGWSKLLKTGRLKADKTAEALEAIERNAELQARLIEDLLDISRIIQGKITLNTSTVNLVAITQSAIDTVRLALENKKIQLQTIIQPNIGQVEGDPARLQQILWNLLSNAVKFTPLTGKITVKLEQIASYVQITISDTGKGISPEFLPHIFNYFWQEDSSITRKFSGLGLGLAIVRNLVELHGGSITAHSPGIGKGATFTIKLPITDHAEISEQNQQPNTSLDLSEIQVLVVDDDTDSLEFVTFVLKMYHAEVITASSGLEALQILAHSQPNVLVSDLGMPQMNGYQLLQEIRNSISNNNREIPAIALSAYAGEFYQQQALAVGFQIHIPKPTEPEALASAVARLAGRI